MSIEKKQQEGVRTVQPGWRESDKEWGAGVESVNQRERRDQEFSV